MTTSGSIIRLLRSRGGNVAVIFALTVSSAIVIGGGGMDILRMTNNRKYLQERVDATALYVANGLTSATLSTAQATAEKHLASLVDAEHGTLSGIVATPSDGTLKLDATLSTESTFLSMVGVPALETTVSTTVTWGETALEIALVLDNTGSMLDSNKLSSLKTAATSMVSTMSAKVTTQNTLKFALVPFQTFVNVGTTYKNASWIDNAGLSPYHSSYFSSSLNRFTLYSNLGKSWPGCVESRPSPYDIDDTAPTASNPSTLFVPTFNPDEPDTTYKSGRYTYNLYPNSYLGDDTTNSDDLVRLKQASKYTKMSNKDFSNSVFYSNYSLPKGPGFGCDVQAVTRLTNSYSSVKTSINAMTASGSTNIPEGLAWGWRMLSPQAPFSDGQSYDSTTLKIVVLLTDGTNSIPTWTSALGGAYSSWGYPYSNRTSTNAGTYMRDGLDAKTRAVCTAIKAKGIKIYTIGLMIDDSAGQQLLSDCSSGTDFYYNSPTAGQLDTVFASIAQKITKLRIAK